MPSQSIVSAEPDDAPAPSATDLDYWYELIPEPEAAKFDGVTVRKLQKDRQVGGGPKYIRLSARCIRYRRIDLREHAEALMVGSTAEPAPYTKLPPATRSDARVTKGEVGSAGPAPDERTEHDQHSELPP